MVYSNGDLENIVGGAVKYLLGCNFISPYDNSLGFH
jgi:hypothetical protein